MKLLEERLRDLRENLGAYLDHIRRVAEEHGGVAYLFGSALKGGWIAASDVDILVEVPDDVDRISVLLKIRKVVKNPKVEVHVLNRRDSEAFKRLIGELRRV